MKKLSRHGPQAYIVRVARPFFFPPAFSLPAVLSTVFALGVSGAILGHMGVSSFWPPKVTSLLRADPVRDAAFGVTGGRFLQTSATLQSEGLNRLFLVLSAVALAAVLVAGLNLVILLKNRATARAHHQAVRVSLGASRASLILDGLAGSAILFGLAAVAGSLVGIMGRMGLSLSWPHESQVAGSLPISGLALSVNLFLLLLVGIYSVRSHAGSLREEGLQQFLSGGSRLKGPRYPEGLRVFLPALQIGLSISLLMGSSLMVAGTMDGFGLDGANERWGDIVRVQIEAHGEGGADGEGTSDSWDALLLRLSRMPRVRNAALFSPGAWVGLGRTDAVWTECGDCFIGNMWVPFSAPSVRHHVVSPDSFTAMGLVMRQGREFTSNDGPSAPLVAVVNETYAREYFDSKGPLGKSLGLGKEKNAWHTVVGVVEDFGIRGIGSSDAPTAAIFLSSGQHPPDRADIFLDLGPDSGDFFGGIAEQAQSDGWWAISQEPSSLSSHLSQSLASLEWFAIIALVLGLLTLGLATYGLFAILAYSVALRRGEIGVRRALGAGPRAIASLVLTRSAKVFLFGVFLGLEGALLLTAGLEGIAFEGQLFDVGLFLWIVGFLAVAALLGTLRPMAHSLRIPPRVAMEGG